jgi:hypothetical protein
MLIPFHASCMRLHLSAAGFRPPHQKRYDFECFPNNADAICKDKSHDVCHHSRKTQECVLSEPPTPSDGRRSTVLCVPNRYRRRRAPGVASAVSRYAVNVHCSPIHVRMISSRSVLTVEAASRSRRSATDANGPPTDQQNRQ